MKVGITGASEFTKRMFESAGPYQWARECLKNSIEAGAKNVHFGIEWEGVEHDGVYRRYIADDGCGMNEDELLKFFSTLGVGAKPIGGVHKNFGVGAKIASLPWNPNGVVVLSWKNSKASMIWIELDPDSGDYELREFDTDRGATCVIDPEEAEEVNGIDWAALKDNLAMVNPDFIDEHGTIVVFLGSDAYPDTVLGNVGAGENAIKGLSVYLNTRFWDLSDVKVTVAELRSEKKANWPQGQDDRDDARRPNNRRAQGARYFLTEFVSTQQGAGKAGPHSEVRLDDGRVHAEWFLWDGERPTTIHAYAKEDGYVAVRYMDELYELTSMKHTFRRFGIVEADVMRRLTIIVTPQLYQPTNGCWGVHPEPSRNRLIFTGNGEKGAQLPMDNWAEEFANNLPEAILQAIMVARSANDTTTIEDPEYRRRLAEKFGKRWKIPVFVKARPDDLGDRVPITLSGDTVRVYGHRKKTRTVVVKRKRKPPTPQPVPSPHPGTPNGERGPQVESVERDHRQRFAEDREVGLFDENGTEQGVEFQQELGIPHIEFTPNASNFEKPWHIALWQRRATGKPTVFINTASPILEQVVAYHAVRYAPHLTDEVRRTVHQVFGEVAACKIAHAQKLTIGPEGITEQELDDEYLSEEALTTGLMGLIAEESLIGQRLGRIGPRRQQQPETA